MEKNSPVTFHVFRSDGSKNPDIKAYFLSNLDLDVHTALEGSLKLKDGTLWRLVMEDAVQQALKSATSVKVLVSFQARTQGNYAVARLFDAQRAALKATKGQTKW